jgi:D-arabinan exo alpha-(1,3)/(1,5)-arabinofuranosidase (non-reducing end)
MRWLLPLVAVVIAVSAAAQPTSPDLATLWQPQVGRSFRSSSADPNWQNGNGDARPIAPGQTLTIAALEGPGVIRHIWFTVAAEDPNYPRTMSFRAYWDGAVTPAVETPLGDFFAVGHGLSNVTVNSAPVHVSSEGRAYNCYWPMPFRKSARLTVRNDSDRPVGALYWYVDWVRTGALPADTRYFCAQYRQEFPAQPGDYLILDAEGQGHFVGVVYSVQNAVASWFGEGDDRFYIDGEAEPSLRGTGTEDYFCDAWGFREFNGPFYGVSLWEGYEVGDRGTVYRWHIPDPILFSKSLRFTIEHKGVTFNEKGEVISGFMERPDYLSSCALWYQVPPVKRFVEGLPAASERLPASPRVVIEAEDLIPTATKSDDGGLETQDGGWSGGKQLFFTPGAQGAFLEVTFSVAEEGLHDVSGLVTHSWDYGIYEVRLDGNPVGRRLLLYSPDVKTEMTRWGQHQLTSGSHTLRFSAVGTQAESGGYFLGLDAILLRKVQ